MLLNGTIYFIGQDISKGPIPLNYREQKGQFTRPHNKATDSKFRSQPPDLTTSCV